MNNKETFCPLCSSATEFQTENKSRLFYYCKTCRSVHVPSDFHLSPENELRRYQLHKNDTEDKGYRNFVSPVVDAVCRLFDKESSGLDYGCGPGSAAANMLSEAGYKLNLYDPYFENHPEVLSVNYDYIICTEVMEHFKHPNSEFLKLKSILKPDGKLFCTTDLYTTDTDFKNWYYKNDSTHIFFYSPESLEFIAEKAGFSSLKTEGRLIIFSI